MKNQIFPSKNHLAFLIIERYDIKLTNIKISDKSIVPPDSAQPPEGVSFLLLFWNFADFSQQKIFKLNFLLFMAASIIL